MSGRHFIIKRIAVKARAVNCKYEYYGKNTILVYNQPKGKLMIHAPSGLDDSKYLKVQVDFPNSDYILWLHGNTAKEWYDKLRKRRLLDPKKFE